MRSDNSSFEHIGLMCLSPDQFYSSKSHNRPVTRALMCATSLNLMYHDTWKLQSNREAERTFNSADIALACQVDIPFQDAKHTLHQWSACMGHVSRRKL